MPDPKTAVAHVSPETEAGRQLPTSRSGAPTLEVQFWKAAGEWLKAGSGMTREQETGAAMVWSWLDQHRAEARADAIDVDRLGLAMEQVCDALAVHSLSPADAPMLHARLIRLAASGAERCIFVGCTIAGPHDHVGEAAREMTPEERAAQPWPADSHFSPDDERDGGHSER